MMATERRPLFYRIVGVAAEVSLHFIVAILIRYIIIPHGIIRIWSFSRTQSELFTSHSRVF